MKMTIAEYIFARIAEGGVKDVFMVSGGGIMYLCDALGRNKDLKYWCNYNEQACAIAAESYARVTEKLGVCLVTTGPGSTNALSGVAGAWVDSIPILVISGQVRTAIMADYRYQRQVGPQEINIIPMADPVTKYAVTVMDPKRIRYELEKALHLATHGRPGPVWLNIPLDVQSAEIDSEKLEPYRTECELRPPLREADVEHVVERLKAAKRPVIIGGSGVVLGGARREFSLLVKNYGIPAVLSIGAMDLLTEDDASFQGRFGPSGQRRGNFAVQNADFVLSVGCSLSLSCIGFDPRFAEHAYKVSINNDPGELKRDNLTIQYPVLADAKQFLSVLLERIGEYKPNSKWLDACAMWKKNYPPMLAEDDLQKEHVDMFLLYDELSRQMGTSDILVSGNSIDGCIIAYQASRVKMGQRHFTSVCYGAMGWDLPALGGACIASGNNRRAVLVTGDGSLQFNIHELLFLGSHKLNAKVFVSSNGGYNGIIGTQDRYFSGRYVGAASDSGVFNPDFAKLAEAYGLKYMRISDNASLSASVEKVFADDEPWLCEVMTSRGQKRFRVSARILPNGASESRPIEDMEPLISREELERNMGIFANDK